MPNNTVQNRIHHNRWDVVFSLYYAKPVVDSLVLYTSTVYLDNGITAIRNSVLFAVETVALDLATGYKKVVTFHTFTLISRHSGTMSILKHYYREAA